MATTTPRRAAAEVTGQDAAAASTMRIPRDRYTSQGFFDLEMDAMWKRCWLMACRLDDVAETGDYAVFDVADQSVVVVRGADGRVRAFHNACLHRGNQLAQGRGHVDDVLVCAYHMWGYALDGRVAHVPDRETFPGLDPSQLCLPEVACDSWGGFVFVNLGPEPQPLLEFLAPLPEQLDPYHFEQMVRTASFTTVVPANWKVVVEAFLEVYHVQAIHPQLLPMLDDVNTTFENYETHSRMIVPFGYPSPRLGDDVAPIQILTALAGAGDTGDMYKGNAEAQDAANFMAELMGAAMADMFDETGLKLPEGKTVRDVVIEIGRQAGVAQGLDYSGLSDDQMIDDWHYHIFPNLVFNTHAGAFLFFRIRPNGNDPHSCLFDIEFYQLIGDPEQARRRTVTDPYRFVPERGQSFGVIIDQDLVNLPGVQKGLRCATGDALVLSEQETRVAKLHEVLERYLDQYVRSS